jgi:nicotinate dehydrogenase subunit B
MPGFRHALTDTQIAELARYMRQRYALSQAPWENLEAAVARVRALQAAR